MASISFFDQVASLEHVPQSHTVPQRVKRRSLTTSLQIWHLSGGRSDCRTWLHESRRCLADNSTVVAKWWVQRVWRYSQPCSTGGDKNTGSALQNHDRPTRNGSIPTKAGFSLAGPRMMHRCPSLCSTPLETLRGWSISMSGNQARGPYDPQDERSRNC